MKPIEMNEQKTTVEELIMKTDIPNSPFTIISLRGGKHFGVLGKYRITEEHNTREEAIKDAEKINWNNITRLISIVTEILKETEV